MANSKGFLHHKQKAPETGGLSDFIAVSKDRFSFLFDLFDPDIAELNFRSFGLKPDSTF